MRRKVTLLSAAIEHSSQCDSQHWGRRRESQFSSLEFRISSMTSRTAGSGQMPSAPTASATAAFRCIHHRCRRARLDGETVCLLNPIEKNARIDVAIGLARQLTPRFQQTPCLRGNGLLLRGGRVFRRGFFRRDREYCRKDLHQELGSR